MSNKRRYRVYVMVPAWASANIVVEANDDKEAQKKAIAKAIEHMKLDRNCRPYDKAKKHYKFGLQHPTTTKDKVTHSGFARLAYNPEWAPQNNPKRKPTVTK